MAEAQQNMLGNIRVVGPVQVSLIFQDFVFKKFYFFRNIFFFSHLRPLVPLQNMLFLCRSQVAKVLFK